MRANRNRTLLAGVAAAAIATFHASVARAGCEANDNRVVCEATVDSDAVNDAIAAADDAFASVAIVDGAVVTGDDDTLSMITNGGFFLNHGTIGSLGAPVSIRYRDATPEIDPDAGFALINTGAINGAVDVAADGDVAFDIHDTGSVLGPVSLASAVGDVFATIAGRVGVPSEDGGTSGSWVWARAGGTSGTLTSEEQTNRDIRTTTTVNRLDAVGGEAGVSIAEGAAVYGSVLVQSVADNATAAIAGDIGDEDALDSGFSAGLAVIASGTNRSTTLIRRENMATGEVDSSERNIDSASGGEANVWIDATGRVFGNVEVNGDLGASLVNLGEIHGDALVNSGQSLVDRSREVETELRDLPNGDLERRTTVTTATNTRTGGGFASAIVANGAGIGGNLTVRGAAGASAVIEGGVEDSVFVVSDAQEQSEYEVATQVETFDGETGYSKSYFMGPPSRSSVGTGIGGDVSAVIAPTGVVLGNLSVATNAGDATAIVGGQLGAGAGDASTGHLTVLARGTGSETSSDYFEFGNSRVTESVRRDHLIGGVAHVGIDTDGTVYGNLNVEGAEGVVFEHFGRARGNVLLRSVFDLSSNETHDEIANTSTEETMETSSYHVSNDVYEPAGGDIEATINATGQIDGALIASALGNISLVSDGVLLGDVWLNAQGRYQSISDTRDATVTRDADSGEEILRVESQTLVSSNLARGGEVVTNLNGVVGAPEDSPIASDVAVHQEGVAGSHATIAGTLYGSFEGIGGGASSTRSEETHRSTTAQRGDADGTLIVRQVTVETADYSEGPSTLAVTGAVRANGYGDGEVEVVSRVGDASLIVDGGYIQGNALLSAGGSANQYGRDATTALSIATPGESFQPVLRTREAEERNTVNYGRASVQLSGARIDGALAVLGMGRGGGSPAVTLDMDAESVVAGIVGLSNVEDQENGFDLVETGEETVRRTGENAVTRTVVERSEYSPAPAAGQIVADIAGEIGGLQALALFDDATITLSGKSHGDITVASGSRATNQLVTTTYSGDGATGLDAETRVTRTEANDAFNYGGVATLVLDGGSRDDEVLASGKIAVSGLLGSTLEISSTTGLLSEGGSIAIGGKLDDAVISPEEEVEGGDGPDAGPPPADGAAVAPQGAPANDRATVEAAPLGRAAAGGKIARVQATAMADGKVERQAPVAQDDGDDDDVTETEEITTREEVIESTQQNSGASVTESGNFSNYAIGHSSIANSYADGKVVKQAITASSQRVTSYARLDNSGRIGAIDAETRITITGVGSPADRDEFTASLFNDGLIFADITLSALGTDSTSTVSMDNTTEPAQSPTLKVVQTAIGSRAAVSNGGLIYGSMQIEAREGGLVNTGGFVGDVNFGAAHPAELTIEIDTSGEEPELKTSVGDALYTQRYAMVQSGLFAGRISVSEKRNAALDYLLPEGTRTLDLNADIILADGSVTLGSIEGETGAATESGAPERLTKTNVELRGTGYFGAGFDETTGIDGWRYGYTPAVHQAYLDHIGVNAPDALTAGGFIAGVELLNHSSDGVFTLVGRAFDAEAQSDFAVDVGTFLITDGEIQLGVAGGGVFGIRGDLENHSRLMLGRLITDGSSVTVAGTQVALAGNYFQSTEAVLGFAVAPGGLQTALAGATGFLAVDGDLTLGGKIAVFDSAGIYLDGQTTDFASVTGDYIASGVDIVTLSNSPFLNYRIASRTGASGETILSLELVRDSYASAAGSGNAAAAADALEAALPALSTALAANPDDPDLIALRDTVIALDFAQGTGAAAQLFEEVAGASFYASLQSISATSGFGRMPALGAGQRDGRTALRASSAGSNASAAVGGTGGIGAWVQPSLRELHFDGDPATGAGAFDSNSSGISFGFELATGSGGALGVGVGVQDLKSRSAASFRQLGADSFLVGGYASQWIGGLQIAAQVAYGWTDWSVRGQGGTTTAGLRAQFESRELSASGRVSYTARFGALGITPFAGVEYRDLDIDAFTEQGSPVALSVGARNAKIVTPEVGLRLAAETGSFRPFAEASYVFEGDPEADLNANYSALPNSGFALQGLDTDNYARLAAGAVAGFGPVTAFGRVDMVRGKDRDGAEVSAGIKLRF